ncbi:MAG TPA: cytochrome c [Bradyrhizobium sp.]|jgi:mono/diheme cytochrome c family protein|uniref:c-type cytochrome n=1 Tax=Bradyrhizobium sp. TaxID=376 RepID=UPI002B88D09D|nr:cytochrome c [Bradyrhizobium sp.]HXB78853.1 cytochrome c [Bradyrhizobium sp.]
MRIHKNAGLRMTAVSLACALIVPICLADEGNPSAQTGAMVYLDYCSSCHGDGLQNTSGGLTFDLRRLRPQDHDRFVNSVLNGKNQMPPWRGVLDQQQIESIWAYIRANVDR